MSKKGSYNMDISQKRILVTGSEGMIGKCLVEELKRHDCNVLLFDKAQGDVTDWSSVSKIGKVDMICHLAAIPSVAYSLENPLEVMRINAMGTLNVLELARKQKVEKFIFISSYLYGSPKYLPIDEKHPLQPSNPYAYSKFVAEAFCESYHQSYKMPLIIFRPFNVYGPNQQNAVIPTILEQMKSKKIVLKDLEPKRDYIYISDVVSAIISALAADIPGYEIFNLGTGKAYSVKELVDIVFSITGEKMPVQDLKQRRPNEIMDCAADIRKAKKLLKWAPEYSLAEGLLTILS
ncbi:MAG: NAD-dependent epimerase/dehydratase family protein [Nanoarchaeota archaeon]|nr:NAD-dependent epimerase/dehydratase family protein [Nanoarchaeota archaeon]